MNLKIMINRTADEFILSQPTVGHSVLLAFNLSQPLFVKENRSICLRNLFRLIICWCPFFWQGEGFSYKSDKDLLEVWTKIRMAIRREYNYNDKIF